MAEVLVCPRLRPLSRSVHLSMCSSPAPSPSGSSTRFELRKRGSPVTSSPSHGGVLNVWSFKLSHDQARVVTLEFVHFPHETLVEYPEAGLLDQGTAGRFGSVHLVAFVEAVKGEEHDGAAVGEIERGVHDPERQLTAPTPPDVDEGRVLEIEVVAIPHVGPDDPPSADHLVLGRAWRRR